MFGLHWESMNTPGAETRLIRKTQRTSTGVDSSRTFMVWVLNLTGWPTDKLFLERFKIMGYCCLNNRTSIREERKFMVWVLNLTGWITLIREERKLVVWVLNLTGWITLIRDGRSFVVWVLNLTGWITLIRDGRSFVVWVLNLTGWITLIREERKFEVWVLNLAGWRIDRLNEVSLFKIVVNFPPLANHLISFRLWVQSKRSLLEQ